MSTNSFVMPNDLSDLCRVCLQLPEESQYLDLSTIYDEEDNLTYGECFTVCTQIDLSAGEGVPHHLCKPCGLELQMSYDFHKKIEESKRVIEQCQRQIEEQKANVTEPHDHSNRLNSVAMEEAAAADMMQLMNEKYVISEVEELPGTSQEMEEDVCELEHENEQKIEETSEVDEDIDELDIVNKMCEDDGNIESKIPPVDSDNTCLEPLQENNVVKEEEEHLDIEDYQNLEALEEEAENPIPTLNRQNLTNFTYIKRPVFCANESRFVPYLIEETVIEKEATEKFILAELAESEDNDADSTNKKNRPTFCSICQKSFKNYNRLSWHMRMHDKNRKRFICPIQTCGRMYVSKQACDLHYKQFHLDEGFTCPTCHKIFQAKQTLEIHMRYHKKEFPFQCNLCERKFVQKGHLTQHIEVKHQNIRYICTEPACGKIFQNSVSLRNHRYTHSSMPFKCNHCGKQYPQKNKLRDHLKFKHKLDYSLDDVESMRQFNIVRKRHAYVKVQTVEAEDSVNVAADVASGSTTADDIIVEM